MDADAPRVRRRGRHCLAGRAGPARASLAIANLTGGIRLLIGLGWPLIYVVHAGGARRLRSSRPPVIVLDRARLHAIGGLLPPLLYMGVVLAKVSFAVADAGVLGGCYALVPRTRCAGAAAGRPHPRALAGRVGLGHRAGRVAPMDARARRGRRGRRAPCGHRTPVFLLHARALAALVGITPFSVVQWLAPVLTELPEMVSAVAWARRVAPTMALLNLVSSAVNQWAMLAAMIPVVFGWAHWRRFGLWASLLFDDAQRFELLLALLQTAVGVALLGTRGLTAGAAMGLFGPWILEVGLPQARPVVACVYGVWVAVLAWRWAHPLGEGSLGRHRERNGRVRNRAPPATH